MSAILGPALDALRATRAPLRRSGDAPPAPAPQLFIVAGSYVKRETVDGSTFPRFVPVLCVVEASSAADISPYSVAPLNAQCVRMTISPASDLDLVPTEARHLMKMQKRAVVMHALAKVCGEPVYTMVPWRDYDPIQVDEQVERWAKGRGVRFASD
jgi:hypothetical protein